LIYKKSNEHSVALVDVYFGLPAVWPAVVGPPGQHAGV
jgi:hypothetical protein